MIVNHAAFDVAVHAQPVPAVTLTDPVVAPAPGFELVGLIEYVQTAVTVTVNEQDGPAVVEQFTVVVPTGNDEPLAGAHVTVPHVPVVVGAG